MVAFYAMLLEGSQGKAQSPAQTGPRRTSAPPKSEHPSGTREPLPQAPSPPGDPSIHINLQIHISPDASSDQIKEIFANISKYIYKT
jgi:hypothetical protein